MPQSYIESKKKNETIKARLGVRLNFHADLNKE